MNRSLENRPPARDCERINARDFEPKVASDDEDYVNSNVTVSKKLTSNQQKLQEELEKEEARISVLQAEVNAANRKIAEL